LDAIDNVIWILPFLALLDIISTFYIGGRGYALGSYEWELFALLFARGGSFFVYLYAAIYLLIMVGIAFALLFVKNKKLNPSRRPDKAVFLIMIGVVFYIYMRLTAAFIMNFFLPSIIQRGLDMLQLTFFIYVGAFVSLGFYTWDTVLSWMRHDDSEKK
jgi:hypothetical protein